MKTTLNIDDALLANAKALAAKERSTLTRLIEEGLHLRLRARATTKASERIRLPVYRGRGGIAKGVDPLSNRSMLDRADDA